MRWIIILILPLFLSAQSPFETSATLPHQTDVFNTKATKINKDAMKNMKIKCRYVCDKKVYKEQVIADAITFYLNSQDYSFSTYNSSK